MELLLRDEVLVFIGTLGACGLLALGVLELIWPSRRAGPLQHSPERVEALAERAEAFAARR
jgi:hypothetical protein